MFHIIFAIFFMIYAVRNRLDKQPQSDWFVWLSLCHADITHVGSALDGNPLIDIHALGNIPLVIHNGIIIRDDR